MGAIYLIIVVLAIISVAWLGKLCAGKGVHPFDFTFALFSVATVFGYFFQRYMNVQTLHYTSLLLVISAVAGVGGALAVFVFNYAIRIGHFGFSNAIYRTSFVIPVVYGILVFNVMPDLTTAAGIFSIIVSIFLISWSDESFGWRNKSGLLWFFIVILSFLLSGLPRIGQMLISHNRLNSSAYLFASYGAGLVVLLAMLAVKRRVNRRAWIYGSGAAIASFSGVFCTIEALATIPASVVFPVSLSTPIILGLLISSLLYRERIKPMGLAGVFLGVAGIVVLALQIYNK